MRNRKQLPWLLILNRVYHIQRQPAVQERLKWQPGPGARNIAPSGVYFLLVLHDSKQLTQLQTPTDFNHLRCSHTSFFLCLSYLWTFPTEGLGTKNKLRTLRASGILTIGTAQLSIKKRGWQSIKIATKCIVWEENTTQNGSHGSLYSTSCYETEQADHAVLSEALSCTALHGL